MPNRTTDRVVRYRGIAIWCAVLLTGVMWRGAVPQFTGGVLDVVVFIPPGAALGVASVWSAHLFAPERFTWRRGLIGAVVGGVVVSPLIAFLVAFSAAWDRASFPIVFNVGAWVAIAGGIGVGSMVRVAQAIARWRFHRRIEEARHVLLANHNHLDARRRGMHTSGAEHTGERIPASGGTARR